MLTSRPLNRSSAPSGGESGQAALFAALSLTFMFSSMGLAVDLGWSYFLKQRVQTAADAAASAAAIYAMNYGETCASVTCGVSYTCAGVTPATNSLQTGCLYATVDGPPVLTATMLENNSGRPPAGFTGLAPSMWIQATVTAANSNNFLIFSGLKGGSISASAVGGVIVPGSCVYALSSSGTSLSTGGTNVIQSNCGIYDAGGFSFNGSGSMSTTQFFVNGNFNFGGSGNISASKLIRVGGTYSKNGSGSITPAYTTGMSSFTDPFVHAPAPTVGSCDYTNFKTTGSQGASLTPGVYCGGIDLGGSGDVTFASGTYIINGGGAQYSFKYTGSGNLSGTNVTFFITGQNGYTAKPIDIAGGGTMSFSAPNSGQYMGLLFYQDRTVTYAGTNSFNGSGSVTGSLYFPTTNLSYAGTPTAQTQAVVAQTITFSGTSNFQADTSGLLTGLAKTTALLQ